jgi:outer membrane immunogenic protein
MRQISFIFLFLIIAVYNVNAQSPLAKGEKQLNAGFGITGWGIPVYGGLELGVFKDITVGLEGSFRTYNQTIANLTYNSTIFGIAGNGNYHFNTLLEIPSNWDFYAGLNLGFYFWSSPSNYPGNGASSLGLGAQVGGRYFFRHNFGVNLELGAGNAFSGGKIGITYIF